MEEYEEIEISKHRVKYNICEVSERQDYLPSYLLPSYNSLTGCA